jgi:16S rRNA (adenine1518-N6/adenine1519-N6)-dimethyltransferase
MSEKFEHKKSLGQHFLNSDYVPKKMCDAAHLEVGDIVLEVGPGTGALTREILNRGAHVIALEADLRAIESLHETFAVEVAKGSLKIFHHDVRDLDPTEFGVKAGKYKVVANIPYYISGLLFRTFLESHCQPSTLVFLVQKEVAARIVKDEKESLLSLSVKVFGDPTYICTVGRSHFTPPPHVDSAIIAVLNISKDRTKNLDIKAFFELLHLGFGQKRKQLIGNLAHTVPRENLEKLFVSLGLSLTVRAEDIPVSTWITLATHLLSPDFPQKK